MKYANALQLLMEVKQRIPQVQEKIDAYFQLIRQEKGKTEEATLLRNELANMLATDDNVFAEADTLISLLEI